MTALKAYIDNDNIITIAGLRNHKNEYLTSGVIMTATVKDSDGNNVTDAVNLAFSYISDATHKAYLLTLYEHSDGYYQAQIDDSVSVDAGDFTLFVECASAGLTAHWEAPISYLVRT